MGELGFGFLEVGTTTPLPQDEIQNQEFLEIIKKNSIINRLGFNNKGVDYLVNNFKKENIRALLEST